MEDLFQAFLTEYMMAARYAAHLEWQVGQPRIRICGAKSRPTNAAFAIVFVGDTWLEVSEEAWVIPVRVTCAERGI